MKRICAVLIILSGLLSFSAAVRGEDEGHGPVPLSMLDAIHRAEEQNTESLLASEKTNEADAVRTQKAAGILPHLSGAASQARETISLAAFGFKPGMLPGLNSMKLGPFNVFDARVSVMQNVFNLASIGDMQAGRAGARKAELEENLARERSGLEGGMAYVELMRVQAIRRGNQSDVQLAERLLREMRDRKDAGLATGLDLTRSETHLSQMRTLLIQAQTREQDADLHLKRVTGMPLDAQVDLTDKLESVQRQIVSLEKAIADAEEKRLEIKVASEEIAQRGAEHRGAIGQQIPSISVNADYGGSGNQPNRNMDDTYTVGVKLSVPIFDGGATIGKISQTRSQMHQAEILFHDIKTQVEEDVRMSRQNLVQAEAEVSSTRETHKLAEQELGQIEDQLKSGVVDSLALVAAETSRTKARDEYLASLARYYASRMMFAYSLGEMEGFKP